MTICPDQDAVDLKAPRIFYAMASGNVIDAHVNWRNGVDDPSQMSITFSSEVEQFCRDRGSPAYIVARAQQAKRLVDGNFVIEHRCSRSAKGWRYHLNEIRYGIGLLKTAIAFRSDYAIIESGSAPYYTLFLFRLFGIKVIPVLHNTLWPAGYPPRSFVSKIVLRLDGMFFRWGATAAICVSPECARQIGEITHGKSCRIEQILAQFAPRLFELRPPPDLRPFRMIFAGRVTSEKGVFDLLEIMASVDRQKPSVARLDICGDGPELAALRARCTSMGLDAVVSIHGRVEPEMLREMLYASHLSIVPTRSGFAEGMAMAAIEPVLVGRPVLTSRVVPAHEVLRGACLIAETDDPASYARKVVELMEQPQLYQELCQSCRSLRSGFFDRSRSYQAALMNLIGRSSA